MLLAGINSECHNPTVDCLSEPVCNPALLSCGRPKSNLQRGTMAVLLTNDLIYNYLSLLFTIRARA